MALRKGQAEENWEKHYLRGMSVLGDIFPGHQTKLAVREFKDMRRKLSPASPVGAGLRPAPTKALLPNPAAERTLPAPAAAAQTTHG